MTKTRSWKPSQWMRRNVRDILTVTGRAAAAAFAAICSTPAFAATPQPVELSTAREWVSARFIGKQPVQPFSFVYGGTPSADLLKRWKCAASTRKIDTQRTEHTLTYSDPGSGLWVRCTATEYRDFPAVEWVLHFGNAGKSGTPILENILPMDASIGLRASGGEFRLHYAEGSRASITDFQPLEKAIGQDGSVKLTSFGGRPSDGILPFFNLVKPDGGGAVMGIGWTGQWAASFTRKGLGSVSVKAGMEATHLKLHPGEEIRTPSVLLLLWSGPDRMRGQNLLRSLLLRHYTPEVNGKPAVPPFAASPHAIVPFEGSTETKMVEGISNIASHKLPVDYWWIDAGWYTCPGGSWARGVGTWDPDPVRYPSGLKPVADAAHKAGMKFLLWFEPERVMPGTWLYERHPEWLLKPSSDTPPDLQYQINDHFHLLNLGNPEALAWAKKKVSGMIASVGIDCYRNDFNLYPLYFWRNGEDPERQGMNEIRYVTGLYDFFDTLHREHPGLLLDNCASGGRRIDFEMLRRALVLTRSDYLWDPTGQQCHTYGLAQWIPITGIGAADVSVYNCRSGLGSHFALAADFYSKDSSVWNAMSKAAAEVGVARRLCTGDFYTLTPYSTANDVWMGWQFHRPDTGEGLVQAFRRQDAGGDTARYRLQGLDPKARYRVTNLDETAAQVVTGQALMEYGLQVKIAGKRGAAVLLYSKVK